MILTESIEVRAYQESQDKAFIYSTWLKNYKHSSYFAKRIRPVTYFKGHHIVIDHLLKKPSTNVIIACPKGDQETILGYLAYEILEKPVVHFTFIKDAFRKMGIARALFEAAAIDPNKICFTHWTHPVDELIQKYPDMIYDPYGL